jgi:hypothetical protein
MDARYFRERAKTCVRLAEELPWNNPGRYSLMDMAENLQRRAAKLEGHELPAQQQQQQQQRSRTGYPKQPG